MELFPDVLKLKTKPSNIIVIINGLLLAYSIFKEYLFLGIIKVLLGVHEVF